MVSALRSVISPRRTASRSRGRSRSDRASRPCFAAAGALRQRRPRLSLVPSRRGPQPVESFAACSGGELGAVHEATVTAPSDIGFAPALCTSNGPPPSAGGSTPRLSHAPLPGVVEPHSRFAWTKVYDPQTPERRRGLVQPVLDDLVVVRRHPHVAGPQRIPAEGEQLHGMLAAICVLLQL